MRFHPLTFSFHALGTDASCVRAAQPSCHGEEETHHFVEVFYNPCCVFHVRRRGVAEVLAAQQAEQIMVSKELLGSLGLVR